MSHLFTVLPFIVSNSALPVVPSSDIRRLTTHEEGEGEPRAHDIWEFGGNALSLTGKQSGKQLSLQGDEPVYSDNYLSMSTGQGSAILSDFTESALPNDTIWAVVRIAILTSEDPSAVILFGTLATLNINTGSGFFSGNANMFGHNARGFSGTNQAVIPNNGEWMFVSYSRRMHSGGALFRLLGGGHPAFEEELTGTYKPSVNPVAIGGAYYDVPDAVSIDVAEFGIIPEALTAYEMQALYLKSKARMAARGIVVA